MIIAGKMHKYGVHQYEVINKIILELENKIQELRNQMYDEFEHKPDDY